VSAGVELDARRRIAELVDAFEEHKLLIEASALAFRVLLAAVPAILFVVGLIGFFGLESLWRDHVVPSLRSNVSPPAFKPIDQAVTYVLHNQQVFWVTAGAAIATWEMSGIVRGVANLLNGLYGIEDDRPGLERLVNSLWLGAVVGLLWLAAICAGRLLPIAVRAALGDAALPSILGWALGVLVAATLLMTAIGLMVRVAPDVERPIGWVTFGAVLVVVGWIVGTLLFALYLTDVASYGTVFGNMATVFVLLEYLFLLAVIFIGGLTIDALAEGRADR
jgi:membrane protein